MNLGWKRERIINVPIYYIRDNGIGFDQQYEHRLFIPFVKLHSAKEYSGSGIGLAIVQRIIKKHGGSIWVVSEKNKGTTFYFSFEPIMSNNTKNNITKKDIVY